MSANQDVDIRLLKTIRSGEESAEEKLIKKYLPMVRHIAVRHHSSVFEYEDLVQEGLIGLLGAIDRYKPDAYNVKFSSFAYLCIQRKISSAVKYSWGNKQRLLNQSLSLQSYINNEKTRTRLEITQSEDKLLDPVEIVENKYESNRMDNMLKENLSLLEYKVAVLLTEGYSAKDIEAKYGITPKRVDNARTRVKSKLKKLVQKRYDYDLLESSASQRERNDLIPRYS